MVDLALTTRELARLIRISGLDLDQLETESPNAPFHAEGTAGKLTGVAGGEAEATVRTIYHRITGRDIEPSKLHRFRMHRSYREMTLKAGKREIRMASVSGLSNAVTILKEIRAGKIEIDLLEVMACPDGCANGGGQPLPVDEHIVRTRSRAIYDMDNGGSIQAAHHNPAMDRIYGEFLGEPGSPACKEYLYTPTGSEG